MSRLINEQALRLDVLDRSIDLGGSHISMIELVADLNDQEISAFFWCFQKLVDCDTAAFKKLDLLGVLRIMGHLPQGPLWPSYLLTTLCLIFRQGQGFIMATGYSFTLVGILSLFTRKKTIFSVRALMRQGLLARCRLVLNALVADVTICNSNAVAASVKQGIPSWLVKFVRVEVIHNYLDSRAASLSPLQAEVTETSDALRIGFVGRAGDPIKGFSSALWCLSKLRNEVNIEFNVFQPKGRLSIPVPEWANGYIGEEIEGIFRRVDLLVLTSHAEGFPRVVLEALSASKLVVARNVGGVSELVAHEQTGFLFGSDTECYEILRSLDSVKIRCIGQSGREFVQENFSRPVAITKYMQLFEELV